METAIPEPDNKCENFRRKDVYGDGRMISWCAYVTDDNLGNPSCLYFSEKDERPPSNDD